MPRSLLTQIVGSNIGLQGLLLPSVRNGVYRASSLFVVPLSFGEFEIIVAPLGLFFALIRKSPFEKILGWTVAIGSMAGIFASGSRGGYVGFLSGLAVFVLIWSGRKALGSKGSLAPVIVGLIGALAFMLIITLIIVWPRAHNMVLGGGVTQASDNERAVQWAAGLPFILSNPITGHGFAMGAYAVDQTSIDSYMLSLLIETGVPGFLFFAGMMLVPVWMGVRRFVSDTSEAGGMAGAIACSFAAFSVNRLVLSQKENFMLMFTLVAIFIVLNYEYVAKRASEAVGYHGRLGPNYRSAPRRLGSMKAARQISTTAPHGSI